MNFDRRSLRVNTEIGLLIDSPEFARQVAAHVDALSRPANCYAPILGPPDAFGHRALSWRTEENGRTVDLAVEPTGDLLRSFKAQVLSLLPIDELL
jgi:putative cardiolipin synthase